MESNLAHLPQLRPKSSLELHLMDTLDEKRVQGFFNRISANFPCNDKPVSVIVTHLLPDRPFMIEALDRQTTIGLLLAKPKSIHQNTRYWLSKKYAVQTLRERYLPDSSIVDLMMKHAHGEPALLLDIGGYFAAVANHLSKHYTGGLLGIVEDTENGLQKYQEASTREELTCPVISVARSPLKNPEDYLVGQSIVYSVEALLREQGDILHGRTACVVGYGKLGRSIANLLHARHVRTIVYDRNPIRGVEAMSHGFSVAKSLERALRGAGLVFCATGNFALQKGDFKRIDHGAYVATVTSSDDELALDDIRHDYKVKQVTDYITRYENGEHHFFLLNRGQAVNFIHGAAVGPFIYLVQAEILASAVRIAARAAPRGITENDEPLRQTIADVWLDCFGPPAIRRELDA
jgi:adenosylhomocysteinase